MTDRFAARLDETHRRWSWLRGTRDERIARALDAIDAELRRVFTFTAPLGSRT